MEKIRVAKKDRHIIDAVKDLSFPNQTDEYNEKFQEWRNNKSNPYVYRFTKNTKEHIYIDGVGFIDKKPQLNEQRAFTKYMLLLGFLLSGMYVVSILIKLLCGFLWDIFQTAVQPNLAQGYTIFISLLYCVIELFIPIIGIVIMMKFLKLPKAVAFPMESKDRFMQVLSVPIMLSMIVLAEICSFLYKKILHIFGLEPEYTSYFLPEDTATLITTAFIYIVVGSIVYELIIHGVLMQSLRQFGDAFALITISAITACIPHSLSNLCYLFITSIVIGYFVLRTGSLMTGIIMQLTFRGYMYSYSVIQHVVEPEMQTKLLVWINLFFLIIGTVALIFSTRRTSSLLSYNFQKTFMSSKEKFFYFITSPSMLLWFVITFLWLILSIQIRL